MYEEFKPGTELLLYMNWRAVSKETTTGNES